MVLLFLRKIVFITSDRELPDKYLLVFFLLSRQVTGCQSCSEVATLLNLGMQLSYSEDLEQE